MNLNEWAKEVHDVAVIKGWWDHERDFGELISLVHCELSEAYEEYRERSDPYYEVEGKPEGVAVELVDAIIRILDTLATMGVDIDDILEKKHVYNKTRTYRHGGKRA